MASDDYGFGHDRENNYDRITRKLKEAETQNIMKKQIPKCVQSDKNGLMWCPECHQILNYVDKYCSHCGQKFLEE